MSVDVEGMDLQVLKSMDWSRWKPEVLIVETFALSIDQVLNDELYQFVAGQGYKLVSWYRRSLMFHVD
jgi:hypothetical protein